MRIVFYSTAANVSQDKTVLRTHLPSRAQEWERLCTQFPEHEFFVVAQPPAPFLLDIQNGTVTPHIHSVQCFVCAPSLTGREVAEKIAALQPDLAIAAGGWLPPFDWFSLNDALVAQRLRDLGIAVLCHSVHTTLTCLHKYTMQIFFEQHGFCAPKTLFIQHDLFFSERRCKEIERNVYKEYILQTLETLRYPVVVKDTAGLSSYKMEVLVSAKMARAFLLSGKNNADKIVQEYVTGLHCGVELYCNNDFVWIFPPFLFSVNKYGLTSPKQSVKVGPVHTLGKNPQIVQNLYAEIKRLAQLLGLNGPAQIDLIFDGKNWHFLEVNPRLSGMTETISASAGLSYLEIMLRTALKKKMPENNAFVCNIKLPLRSANDLETLYKEVGVLRVYQIQNSAARQEREKGYAELIFGGFSSYTDFCNALTDFCNRFCRFMESAFVQKATELCRLLENQYEINLS